jgi:hypothetical protein
LHSASSVHPRHLPVVASQIGVVPPQLAGVHPDVDATVNIESATDVLPAASAVLA